MVKTLIVEDSVSFRQRLKEILTKRLSSVFVEEVSDSRKALQKVDAFRPDIVFMDSHLPQGKGLEMTSSIKAHYPQTRIAILTWHDLPGYKKAAYRSGADYFFSKASVTGEEICSLVQAFSSGC